MISHCLNKQLFILLISVFFISTINAETNDQHTKVVLRTIGHEFLLQLKDSTSRILPIEKIDGRYAVQFERVFSFEPDLLSFAVFKVLEKSLLIENYIVEVEKCGAKEVIYSFEASQKKDKDMTPCKERALPKDCYVFFFTIIEDNKIILPNENPLSSLWIYMYAIITLIIVACVLIYIKRRKKSTKLKPGLINIGKYQFDKKGMILRLKAQSIDLSSKESDLLFLLFSNENKTLEREYILNHIWGDDGNYVGRTLDVFISKLRKKLEADSSLKIINIRGVGYRFVIN